MTYLKENETDEGYDVTKLKNIIEYSSKMYLIYLLENT